MSDGLYWEGIDYLAGTDRTTFVERLYSVAGSVPPAVGGAIAVALYSLFAGDILEFARPRESLTPGPCVRHTWREYLV
jgi:hypothetical protein